MTRATTGFPHLGHPSPPPAVTLSVLTPILNGVDVVEACVESVRRHAGDDYEHILIDGGSTDGTLTWLEAAVREDARMRLIRGPDTGQSHALNKGVAAARGQVLGILNADDEYLAQGPQLAVAVLRAAPEPSFYWGACEVEDHLAGTTWTQKPGSMEPWRLIAGWRVAPFPVNPSSYFYHRYLHALAGGYREDEHFAMDLEFLLRASRYLASVHHTDQVIGRFRLAPGTKTYHFMQRPDRHAHHERLVAPLRRQLTIGDRLRCEACRRWPRLARLL